MRALNELKGRDGKPILVLVSDPEFTGRLVARRDARLRRALGAPLAGALTIVAKARTEVPELITAGTGTVGVLTATSANPAGGPPSRTASQSARYFPRGLGLVIDGGRARSDLPSTVVDVSGEAPRLIRRGVVPRYKLEEALKSIGATLV